MTTQTIRKSGNASIVSIPKRFLELLGLHIGDELDIDIKNEQIILKAHKEETLESMLELSDKDSFKVIEEDAEWLNSSTKGLEI
jgi:antitoxin ChpS